MAQVLEEMYPGIKLTLGPISMGFIMMWILKIRKSLMLISKKIEDRVLEISRGKHEFKLRPVSKRSSRTIYNVYKTELITNLEDGTITFCDHDTFTDLCRGGHIPNTGIIKAMKVRVLPEPTER
jgi:threonyl-tRNA synthetase